MPNWTDNVLIVNGEVENVKAFFTALAEKNNNLAALMPIPDEIENLHQGSRTIDGVQVDAWYDDKDGVRPLTEVAKQELIDKYGTYKPIDWQYANWGTKWGDCDTEVFTDKQGKKIISFMSAWGPPWKLLHDIAVKYNITIIDTVSYEFEEDIHIDKYPMKQTDVDKNNEAFKKTEEMLKQL